MQTEVSNWTKLRTLTAAEWRVLFTASLLLPAIWTAVHAGALNACLRQIARPRAGSDAQVLRPRAERDPRTCFGPHAPSTREIARIAGLVGIAARYSPAPVTCLSRSIVLAWILRRHGVDSDLRIGVRMTKGALDAHAWLERDGIAIDGTPQLGPPFLPFNEPIAGERAK